MTATTTLNNHQLRCLKKHGWEIVCHEPLELRHGDGESVATGQAAQCVVNDTTQGEPNYEEMIRHDGRVCNCEEAEKLIEKLALENDGDYNVAERLAAEQFASGAVHDAQGIYLCRACSNCVEEKLSAYRPEILTG